jgi:hypothetical protein
MVDWWLKDQLNKGANFFEMYLMMGVTEEVCVGTGCNLSL